MDRQEDIIANLQGEQSNRDPNARRHGRRNHEDMDEFVSENTDRSEIGEDYESEFVMGRNRRRGNKSGNKRATPRDRNKADGNLGSINMKIPSF